MAELGCDFSDGAELSGLRLQYGVVCLGFCLCIAVGLLPTVAAFYRLPSRVDCDTMERDVMGDMCRHRNDTSMLKHISISGRFFLCVCSS